MNYTAVYCVAFSGCLSRIRCRRCMRDSVVNYVSCSGNKFHSRPVSCTIYTANANNRLRFNVNQLIPFSSTDPPRRRTCSRSSPLQIAESLLFLNPPSFRVKGSRSILMFLVVVTGRPFHTRHLLASTELWATFHRVRADLCSLKRQLCWSDSIWCMHESVLFINLGKPSHYWGEFISSGHLPLKLFRCSCSTSIVLILPNESL